MDVFQSTVTALDLAIKALEYAKKVYRAPESIGKLAQRVRLTATSVEMMRDLWKEQCGDKNRAESVAIDEFRRFTYGGVAQLKKLLTEIEALIEKFRKVAEFLDSSVPNKSFLKRLAWPRVEHEIRAQVAELDILLNSFGQILGVLQSGSLSELQDDSQEVKSTVKTLRRMVELRSARDTFEESLEWLPLGRIDIVKKRDEEHRKSEHSPPAWIMSVDSYRQWTAATFSADPSGSISEHADRKSTWLWALGEPGTGKTCLASFLAGQLDLTNGGLENDGSLPTKTPDEELKDLQDLKRTAVFEFDDEFAEILEELTISGDERTDGSSTLVGDGSDHSLVGVAIFYCSYKIKEQQDSDTILKSLAHQLLLQLKILSPRRAWERIKAVKRMKASSSLGSRVSDTIDLLDGISTEFSRTYLIIDALDEIPSDHSDLLQYLQRLRSNSVRVFITSRDGMDGSMGKSAEQLALNIRIRPEDSAIRAFVQAKLEHIANRDVADHVYSSCLPEAISDPRSRQALTERIVAAALGNFLYAELQINGLRAYTNLADLEEKLKRDLPENLDELLTDMIERVTNQSSLVLQDIGMRSLVWTIYARQTLTVTELQHALVLARSTRKTINFERAPTDYRKQTLVESTCYFLQIDDTTTNLHIHKAIRDYCCGEAEVGNLYFKNANLELAKVCLRYLALDHLQTPCDTKGEWEHKARSHPFLVYAASNWASHLELAGEQRFLDEFSTLLFKDVLKKSKTMNHVAFAMQSQLASVGWDGAAVTSRKDKMKPIVPVIQILACHDLPVTTERWIEFDNDVDRTSVAFNSTALFLACVNNHDETVRILLEHGADPRKRSFGDVSCLMTAASKGYGRVVNELMAHEETARQLLSQTDSRGRSALHQAAQAGHESVLETLLEVSDAMENGQDILALQDTNGCNVLHEATKPDRGSLIDLIVSRPGGEALLQYHSFAYEDTPIHLAAITNKQNALEALLRCPKIDTSVRQFQGKVPLHQALQRPYSQSSRSVHMLLPRTDLTSRDSEGRTILHYPAAYGWPRHYDFLLAHTPIELLYMKDKQERIPLIAAVRDQRGQWEQCVTKLLAAPDFVLAEADAWEVLEAIADRASMDPLIELLKNAPKIWPWIPHQRQSVLHRTIRGGRLCNVKYVCEKYHTSKQLEMIDYNGYSPLLYAVTVRKAEIVKYLIANQPKPDLDVQDNVGRSALHWAVESGNADLLDVLLKAGANPGLRDHTGTVAGSRASTGNPCRKLQSAIKAWPELNRETDPKELCMASEWTDHVAVVGNESTRTRMKETSEASGIRVRQPIAIACGECMRTGSVPAKARVPILRLDISITSRDQGFADHLINHPHDRGTFNNSHTWFDIALIRQGKIVQEQEFTRNRLGIAEFTTHKATWCLQRGHEGEGSRGRGPELQDEVKHWIRSIRPGDEIAVIAKTQPWEAWTSFVWKIEIKVYYESC